MTGLRGRITEALLFGPVPLAMLATELDEPLDTVRDELRRMADARIVRSGPRGWDLRTEYRHRPRSVAHLSH